MSVRWWWSDTGTLGSEYVGPNIDVRTGEYAPWNDDVTEVGALVLGDGNDALVIEGSPEALHNLLRRLRALLPDEHPTPFYTGSDTESLLPTQEEQA